MFVTDVGCEEEMTTTSYDKMIIFGHVNKAFSHTSPPFSTFWFQNSTFVVRRGVHANKNKKIANMNLEAKCKLA